jgi:hypothetical protein
MAHVSAAAHQNHGQRVRVAKGSRGWCRLKALEESQDRQGGHIQCFVRACAVEHAGRVTWQTWLWEESLGQITGCEPPRSLPETF